MPDLQDVPIGSRIKLPCGCVGVRSIEAKAPGAGITVGIEGDPYCSPHRGKDQVDTHPRTQVVVLGTVDVDESNGQSR